MKFSEFLKSPKSKSPHYLLIGNPVGHSVSPLMHNFALDYHGLPGEYLAVSVSLPEITSLIAHCNADVFLGANITIPHKESLYDSVDSLTEEAMEIRAINTLIKREGKLIGHNTDAYGFRVPIEEYQDDIEGTRAIIFGTGGATKAIVYALRQMGIEETVMVSRRPSQYEEDPLLNIQRCTYDNWTAFANEASIIINATPLGMVPNTAASPVGENETEHLKDKICYDVVYNPRETTFLKQAAEAGGIPVGGLDMLIYQGAESFKCWTGKEFPVGMIRMRLDDVFPS